MGWRLRPDRRARVGSQTDGDTAYEPPVEPDDGPDPGGDGGPISYTVLPLALLLADNS